MSTRKRKALVQEQPGEDFAEVTKLAAANNRKITLGVLQLNSISPLNNGDVDNPLSFKYRVIYRVVKGFTFEMLLSGKDFIAGVKWLEQQGATGITGDCGYMFLFQSLARTHASVPVFMSSLCQLPLIEMAVESPGKVLILTSCG
jgi:hypothetical protein